MSLRLYWKIFRGFPNFSEHFRTLPKIFENFQKVSEDRFENFPSFSDFSDDFGRFQRLPIISEGLKKKNSKTLEGSFKHFATISEIFRRFPKTSEDR